MGTSAFPRIYIVVFLIFSKIHAMINTRSISGRVVSTLLQKRLFSSPSSDVMQSISKTIQDPYSYHVPVMLKECMDSLNVQPGRVYVDGTLGGGGHTHEILKRGGKVIAFDQDPDAIARSSTLLHLYLQTGDLEIHQANFRYMRQVILEGSSLSAADRLIKQKLALPTSILSKGLPIDGVLLDLGISSHQIDERERGFSFGGDGPLDMRMHQGQTNHIFDVEKASNPSFSLTAAMIVNSWHEDDIADVLYHYGEERFSRRLARAIVHARPLKTTSDLEKVLSSQTLFKERAKTLARCFQALRIRVNDELGALEECLRHVDQCIKPGGRLTIMSYHSLEDRRVKQYLKVGPEALLPQESYAHSMSEKFFNNNKNNAWNILTKKAIIPTEQEQAENRRSRSAKLRCAERSFPESKISSTSSLSSYEKKKLKKKESNNISKKNGNITNSDVDNDIMMLKNGRTLGMEETRKVHECLLLRKTRDNSTF